MGQGFELPHGGRKRLIARWNRLLGSLGLEPGEPGAPADSSFAVLDDLLIRHTEPQRYYHNLAHLDLLLELLPPDPRLEFAVWFHDAVYDPTRGDNEAQSARLAEEALGRLGLEPALIRGVVEVILATQTHQADDPAAALFLDADLAILGADPRVYDRYARAIRLEFAWVPGPLFAERRAAVLRKFLDRPRIYQTEGFARLEGPARENLRRELEGLTAP